MEKKSWVCTVIIQLALCFALYYVVNMGQPQTTSYHIGTQRQHNEIYFISVQGGFRTVKQQTHLLKQIEKVINSYKVEFVINISELGEEDPFLHNATQYFHSVKTPWYTTIALKEDKPDFNFKQVNISSWLTLDFIALDTQKLQESSSGVQELQLKRLSRKLELSNSNWHVVVGFHPLFCNQISEQMNTNNDVLHQMLLKHGVDVYLSAQLCANEARVRGPYLTYISQQGTYIDKQMVNMFLLHRVSPLEITTYGVSFKGKIVHRSTVRQRGRESM